MDGKDVLVHFDGRIAAELRLTEAIDRKLLCPFQYFAISIRLTFESEMDTCGYDKMELENIYISDDLRVREIIRSLYKYVTDIDEVIGLGFCVV